MTIRQAILYLVAVLAASVLLFILFTAFILYCIMLLAASM